MISVSCYDLLGKLPDGLSWVGRFSQSNRDCILFYNPNDGNWWLGVCEGNELWWGYSGNTMGANPGDPDFGDLGDGRPFWIGNFSPAVASQSQVLFYYPGDGNWWLGIHDGNQLKWSYAGNTMGANPGDPDFGQVWDDRPFWTANFSPAALGRSQLLFYYPGDGNWWLGIHHGDKLHWSYAGNTMGASSGDPNFGQVWDGRPFWIGRFWSATGQSQVLFYYPGDGNWWLGECLRIILKWDNLASEPADRRLRMLLEIVENAWVTDDHHHKYFAPGVLDTVKIIESPHTGYIGVYHTQVNQVFSVNVATSPDLLTWTYRATLDEHASQPTIKALENGGFLVVEEADDGENSWLRFRHYADLPHLLEGTPIGTFDAPRSLSASNEGTPSVYSVSSSDLDNSVIDVGFHYYNGETDREGRGKVINFNSWITEPDTQIDAAIEAWDTSGDPSNKMKIGGRDNFEFYGCSLNLQEAQLDIEDDSSWRAFLYNRASNNARRLNIKTHHGSKSFANPKITLLRAPSGIPAIVITLIIFSDGAAPGEAGELVYFREY